jgi:hypothetical protein
MSLAHDSYPYDVVVYAVWWRDSTHYMSSSSTLKIIYTNTHLAWVKLLQLLIFSKASAGYHMHPPIVGWLIFTRHHFSEALRYQWTWVLEELNFGWSKWWLHCPRIHNFTFKWNRVLPSLPMSPQMILWPKRSCELVNDCIPNCHHLRGSTFLNLVGFSYVFKRSM